MHILDDSDFDALAAAGIAVTSAHNHPFAITEDGDTVFRAVVNGFQRAHVRIYRVADSSDIPQMVTYWQALMDLTRDDHAPELQGVLAVVAIEGFIAVAVEEVKPVVQMIDELAPTEDKLWDLALKLVRCFLTVRRTRLSVLSLGLEDFVVNQEGQTKIGAYTEFAVSSPGRRGTTVPAVELISNWLAELGRTTPKFIKTTSVLRGIAHASMQNSDCEDPLGDLLLALNTGARHHEALSEANANIAREALQQPAHSRNVWVRPSRPARLRRSYAVIGGLLVVCAAFGSTHIVAKKDSASDRYAAQQLEQGTPVPTSRTERSGPELTREDVTELLNRRMAALASPRSESSADLRTVFAEGSGALTQEISRANALDESGKQVHNGRAEIVDFKVELRGYTSTQGKRSCKSEQSARHASTAPCEIAQVTYKITYELLTDKATRVVEEKERARIEFIWLDSGWRIVEVESDERQEGSAVLPQPSN